MSNEKNKLGKRELYKLAKRFFSHLDFPKISECDYSYCQRGKDEYLRFNNITISRNVPSGIFTLQTFSRVLLKKEK